MSDFSDWYNRIPFFTKWWLTLTLGFSLAGRIGLFKPLMMVLLYSPLVNDFQIWRPITALLYYPVGPATGFHFLVNCYFLYHYSLQLEKEEFDGRPADYFYMLLINWFSCTLIALAIELPLLMDCMVLSILYVWCQLNKDRIVQFWFGTMFKAMYLPWVLFGFNFIIAGGGVSELTGILAGHIYYFLKFTYPQEYAAELRVALEYLRPEVQRLRIKVAMLDMFGVAEVVLYERILTSRLFCEDVTNGNAAFL